MVILCSSFKENGSLWLFSYPDNEKNLFLRNLIYDSCIIFLWLQMGLVTILHTSIHIQHFLSGTWRIRHLFCDVESGSKNPWSNQDKCIYLPCAGGHSGSIRHRFTWENNFSFWIRNRSGTRWFAFIRTKEKTFSY